MGLGDRCWSQLTVLLLGHSLLLCVLQMNCFKIRDWFTSTSEICILICCPLQRVTNGRWCCCSPRWLASIVVGSHNHLVVSLYTYTYITYWYLHTFKLFAIHTHITKFLSLVYRNNRFTIKLFIFHTLETGLLNLISRCHQRISISQLYIHNVEC
jgi:hypothetical protein